MIERLIGRGGMGAVFLARQLALGKKLVAIKQMQVSVADPVERARVVEQFQKEARLLASLEHPSLVHVYDYFEEAENHYLVMSYVEGKNLEDIYAERQSSLDIEDVLGWMDQVCVVLTYLHGLNPSVIYRDLKPSNVMVDKNNKVWLLDFGIAKVAEPDSKTSTLIKGAGTLGFAPVEQFGHSSTDARSDIYSLGATVYAMVTGQQPPVSVDLMLSDARLVPPTRYNSEVTAELEAVIFKMMALRKDDRYQTMKEAHAALLNATRKLHASRERKAARDAPGALRLRFVKPEGKPMEAVPDTQSEVTRAAGAHAGGTPTMMPAMSGLPPTVPAEKSTFPGKPGLMAPTLSHAPTVVDTPRWVNKLEEAETDPTVFERRIPWYRGPYALWYVYIGVTVLCTLLAIPTFGGLRSFGLVAPLNSLFYVVGNAITRGGTEEIKHAGGLIAQIAIPLGIAYYFYNKEDFYPALLALYIVIQGVGDVGIDLATATRAGMGAGTDLYLLLGVTDPKKLTHISSLIQIAAHLSTAVVIVYMVRWLHAYRPRRRIIVVP